MTYISSGTIYVKPSTAIGIEKTKQECGINPESIDTHYNDKFGEINIDDESESMDNITNFCQLIAEIDKTAEGEVYIYFDYPANTPEFKIKIEEGRVRVFRSCVSYKHAYYYDSNDVKTKAKKLLKKFGAVVL